MGVVEDLSSHKSDSVLASTALGDDLVPPPLLAAGHFLVGLLGAFVQLIDGVVFDIDIWLSLSCLLFLLGLVDSSH